jgi:hypothetical protein
MPKEKYNRDSIFIAYTVNQFVENKYRDFDVFYDMKTKVYVDTIIHADTKVYVDTILYSPDTLKLFSLVIISLSKKENDIEQEESFYGRAVVAYRKNINEIWQVYPVSEYKVSWSNYNGARNVIRRCYFEELKETSTHRGEFKYPLGDIRFWDGLYFKKGLDVDSLYFFQTEYNFRSKKYDKVVPYLNINYPKDLIEQFGNVSD